MWVISYLASNSLLYGAIRPKGGAVMSQATKYEILYIIRPDMNDEAKQELISRFDQVLSDHGSEVVESKDWAKRRLALNQC